MRGVDVNHPKLFVTYLISDYVPPDHPLRAPRKLIDEALVKSGLHVELLARQGALETPREAGAHHVDGCAVVR